MRDIMGIIAICLWVLLALSASICMFVFAYQFIFVDGSILAGLCIGTCGLFVGLGSIGITAEFLIHT
jgi:hypothetical protein